jgi:ribosomal protein L29
MTWKEKLKHKFEATEKKEEIRILSKEETYEFERVLKEELRNLKDTVLGKMNKQNTGES